MINLTGNKTNEITPNTITVLNLSLKDLLVSDMKLIF